MMKFRRSFDELWWYFRHQHLIFSIISYELCAMLLRLHKFLTLNIVNHFFSHFSHSFSFSSVTWASSSSQVSSSHHFSRHSFISFRWFCFFFIISLKDENHVQSFQNHLNQLYVFSKYHCCCHTRTFSSSLYAFFFDKIKITESRRHHHYLITTSESIFQDLNFNKTVNSTLIRSKYRFEWTKTRNWERRFHILSSSDTNSKAFIYVVSNISTCLILCRIVW